MSRARDHIISHFFTELKIYYHSLFITYLTISALLIIAVSRMHVINETFKSLVRVSDRCTEGFRFNSSRGLRFFLCALLVTCSSNFTCNESDYNEENLLSSRITIFVRHMQSSTFDPRFTLKSPSFAIPGVFGNLGV